MKQVAFGTSWVGLALMASVALLLCGPSGIGLANKALIFLSGVVLFAVGGSAYSAVQREEAAAPRRLIVGSAPR